MNHLLEVKDLSVTFQSHGGQIRAVRGVSFCAGEGESVAIVGESGCGKTVTAKSIMGLLKTPPGKITKESQILFQGKNLLSFSSKEWQAYRGTECSMIFQDALAALNPTITVGHQVEEKLKIHGVARGKEAREEAIRLLGLVGITNPDKRAGQYPHQFSGGMRQRVMIAIALACNPRLLIADEPTTALDVTVQAEIIELIKELQQKFSMAVILITHDLGIVAGMAKKIVVMYAGRVVEEGSSHEIFYEPAHPYTKALLRSVPRLDAEEGETLEFIEGAPPDMSIPVIGCAFADRCPNAAKRCRGKQPPIYQLSPGHVTECWLYHPEEKEGKSS